MGKYYLNSHLVQWKQTERSSFNTVPKDAQANAETNLSVLNKTQYAGSYTYDKYGSDIFDMLTGGSKYSSKG